MKILHILYQSLPQISGSSIRSRDILMSQKEIGLDIAVVTSPFQSGLDKEEKINDISYLRTSIGQKVSISDKQKPFLKRLIRFFKLIPFYWDLQKLIKAEKPDILHAHAMFFCGLPALYLGKKYNLPVVYEVRSLWMLKKNTIKKRSWDKVLEHLLLKLELFVMKRVDIIIAINDNLKNELLSKGGFLPEKIIVINNAVNTTLIDQLKKGLKSNHKRGAVRSFGYIGTLTPHEGIDFLINAFKVFGEDYESVQLRIYGNGIEADRIKQLCEGQNNITFYGPINPDEIGKAFSTIDVIVNPRYKNKLTDTVTPLKPLEAMAYEKLFIGSDVGGIKELVSDKVNGFLFRSGSQQEFLNTLKKVYSLGESQQAQIRERAKSFVINERSWLKNAKKYSEIYHQLLESNEKL